MGPAPLLMTAHEYFKTPETVKPMELAFGALRVADAPSAYHQSIVIELFRALDQHVRDRQLGRMWIAPLDVVLSEARALIVQPDLFFVAHDRSGIVKERIYGPPDLVIEVLSPNPRIGSTDERVGWFARFGVRECWLVDPLPGGITVMDFGGATPESRPISRTGLMRSSVLPELALPLTRFLP